MSLENTKAAEIFIFHGCFDKLVRKIVFLGASSLEWLVHNSILDVACAIFTVKALSTVGVNVLRVYQALQNTVGKTSVSQILEPWEFN